MLPSGLLDHIRGDEMRKEEATSARRWQNNRTKDPIPISAVVTLPPSSLSPPPRVFALRERVHPIFPVITKHCPHVLLFSRDTPCPVLSIATRAPVWIRDYPTRRLAHLGTATWTLLRQLMSVLMVLVCRVPPRPHRVHHRERYTRHICDTATFRTIVSIPGWLSD